MIYPEWPVPDTVKACFTTRLDGCSQAPYDSFNLGMHVGDEAERVVQNRALLFRHLGLPAEPEWINQTHSTRVVRLEEDSNRNADAAITGRAGMVAVVMVADCLPILVSDRSGREVAAIHAGWRGLQGGVIENCIGAMQSPVESLVSWIGPAISKKHFEVGDEVREAFIESACCPHIETFFSAHGVGHWMCDLPAIAEQVLKRLGVTNIVRDPRCTYAKKESFYSYRRDGITGRQAALIWID